MACENDKTLAKRFVEAISTFSTRQAIASSTSTQVAQESCR